MELEHLGLISINDPSQFTIRVTGGDDAELAVSVQGKLYFNFCRAVGTRGVGGHCVFKWILRGHFKSTPNATILIMFEVISVKFW